MNEAELALLTSPQGTALLDELGPLADGDAAAAAVIRLRKAGHPAELVSAVVSQARLRARARTKLGDAADRLLFTDAGLQQATRAEVARRHADRYREAGITHVADLGCGIGADALAFAAAGLRVRAVERDPVTAAIAAHNLAAHAAATVELGDAEDFPVEEVDGLWLDPARRSGEGRDGARRAGRLVAADWSPSLDFAFGLAARRPTGVKLGPGLDRALLPEDAEAQWVSVRGDVVELAVWSGCLARPGVGRSALLLGADGPHELSAAHDAPDADPGPIGEYLLEPDGAVIRARLIGDLARALRGRMLDPTIAWISCDAVPDSPFGQAFRVVAELAVDERALRRELAARGVGTLEIKVRGLDIDPHAFRRRLAPKGDARATLILTRVAGRRRAILAERLPSP